MRLKPTPLPANPKWFDRLEYILQWSLQWFVIQIDGHPCVSGILTGVLLWIPVGRIGYDLFNSEEDWKPFALAFANLSFNKSDQLWKDVMTPKKGKDGKEIWQITTQRGPVMRAVARARQKIGLDPEPEREFPGAVLAAPEIP